MKRAALLVCLAASYLVAGCSPGKPSTDDARAAFERELRAQVSSAANIVDFEKTDGLTYRQEGVEAYDLEFAANVEVPGARFERDLYRGKVTFIRTEKGWRARSATGAGEAEAAARQQEQQNRAAITKIAQDVRMLELALTIYKLDNFGYPSTEQGLGALVQEPTTEPRPRNWKPDGYVKSMPVDPWGNAYRYENPGNRGDSDVDIFSLGSDNLPGGEGSAADLGNWLYRP
jgi:general secretion pathway protein G